MVKKVGEISRELSNDSFYAEVTFYAHIRIISCALAQGSVGITRCSLPKEVRQVAARIVRSGYNLPCEGVYVVQQESLRGRCDLAPRRQGDGSVSIVPVLQRFRNRKRLSWD